MFSFNLIQHLYLTLVEISQLETKNQNKGVNALTIKRRQNEIRYY